MFREESVHVVAAFTLHLACHSEEAIVAAISEASLPVLPKEASVGGEAPNGW